MSIYIKPVTLTNLLLPFLALSLFVSVGAFAQQQNAEEVSAAVSKDPLAAKFVVLFDSIKEGDGWRSQAYQGSVEEYISGFQNLQVVNLPEKDLLLVKKNCANKNDNFLDCIKDLVSKLDFNFHFLYAGQLDGETVIYRIFEKQTNATFADGEIDVDDISNINLQVASLQTIKPFIKPGGIIEQVLAEDKKLLTLDLPQFLVPYIPDWLLGVSSSLLALLGGVCWGVLILLFGRFSVGSIHGVDRIASTAVSRFVRSWLEILILKMLGILVLLLPAFTIGYLLVTAGLVTNKFLWLFLFPTLALLTVFLFLIFSWMIAEILERLYLKKENVAAWNDKIKKYYFSYATKLGVDFPETLIDKIRFTAGNTSKVMCVGGGLIETTVIIPKAMAVLALDEIDMTGEVAEGRDPSMPSEMRSIITPQELSADKFIRDSEDAYDKFIKDFSKIIDGRKGEAQQESSTKETLELKREINQEAGVWGYVLPRTKDKSIPLISDTSDDLEVVDELIREHHVQFYKSKLEETFDDLDLANRDFLFGVLVQKIAMIHRWEHILCNLHHVINNFIDSSKSVVNFAPRFFRAFYHNNLSSYYDSLSDHYVMFNQAQHHLIQYYFFLLKGRKRELTQRASLDKLVNTTNKITTWLIENPADPKEESNQQLELRRRLTELSHFANLYVDLPKRVHFFPWRKVGLASAGILAISIQTLQALEFAPTYEKRQAELADKIKEFEEKDNDRKQNSEKVQAASANSITEDGSEAQDAAIKAENKNKAQDIASKKIQEKSNLETKTKSKVVDKKDLKAVTNKQNKQNKQNKKTTKKSNSKSPRSK